jgi:hypothetical protein
LSDPLVATYVANTCIVESDHWRWGGNYLPTFLKSSERWGNGSC